MNPEAADAIRIADKHLPHAPLKRREALAKEIVEAIMRHATDIATDAIKRACAKSGTVDEEDRS